MRPEGGIAARREVEKRDDADGSSWRLEHSSDGPTPEEETLLAETLEGVMDGLNEREREILSLKLQGYVVAEIAQHVQRTERTVQRLLAQVRDRLEGMCGAGK